MNEEILQLKDGVINYLDENEREDYNSIFQEFQPQGYQYPYIKRALEELESQGYIAIDRPWQVGIATQLLLTNKGAVRKLSNASFYQDWRKEELKKNQEVLWKKSTFKIAVIGAIVAIFSLVISVLNTVNALRPTPSQEILNTRVDSLINQLEIMKAKTVREDTFHVNN